MPVKSTVLAALCAAAFLVHAIQDTAVLRITVTIVDADKAVRPVPRHALLISENPSSAAPRRIVTSAGGTAEVRLRPGNYTVESDRPLVFQGKTYEWVQTVDVAPGKDAVLALTAANAQSASTDVRSTTAEAAASEVLMAWQNTVVSIWTPTARGAAFLVDPRGLLLTNQRIVGTATAVEVQLTLTRKVAARVIAADRDRNVAVLWIDPAIASSLRPATLGYRQDGKPAVTDGQSVFAIDAAAIEQKTLASGSVTRIDGHTIASDVRIDDNSSGAPLLTAAGDAIGIVIPDDPSAGRTHAVRIDDARAVIVEAEKQMKGAAPPPATLLPVEPQRPFPQDALDAAVQRRAAGAAGYEVHGADFDVTFLTPALVYGAQHEPERTTGAKTAGGRQDIVEIENARRALQDFGNWSEYVAATPPVLMIRATPKLVEGFWMTVGRMAAQTQGVSLPPFKRMKDSFARMRVSCGGTEVVPIHPFTIVRQVDDTTSVSEGLYVYDPGAIGPHCGKVTLSLYSEKQPDKADARSLDAKLLDQIAKDFAAFLGRPQGRGVAAGSVRYGSMVSVW